MSLCLFLSSKLNVFSTLHRLLMFSITYRTLQLYDKLLGHLCLSSQNGLCLAVISTLFSPVPASALAVAPLLGLFILRHFMLGMLIALLAVCVALVWNVDLKLFCHLPFKWGKIFEKQTQHVLSEMPF